MHKNMAQQSLHVHMQSTPEWPLLGNSSGQLIFVPCYVPAICRLYPIIDYSIRWTSSSPTVVRSQAKRDRSQPDLEVPGLELRTFSVKGTHSTSQTDTDWQWVPGILKGISLSRRQMLPGTEHQEEACSNYSILFPRSCNPGVIVVLLPWRKFRRKFLGSFSATHNELAHPHILLPPIATPGGP